MKENADLVTLEKYDAKNDKVVLKELKNTLINNMIAYLIKAIKIIRVYYTKDEPENCTCVKKINVPLIDGYFVFEIGYNNFVLWCGYIQI